jgi:hypothetical protein
MGLTMLLSLAFIIGGMFLTNDLQAQTGQHTLVKQAPNGKAWVTTQQADLSVQAEISSLTSAIVLLTQQGADDKTIKTKKAELQYYMLVKEALNAGYAVSTALDYALAKSGGSETGATKSSKKPELMKSFYNKAVTLLTV